MGRARKPVNASSGGMSPELKTMAVIGGVVVAGMAYFLATGGDKKTSDDGKGEQVASAEAGASVEAYSTEAAGHGSPGAKAVLVKYTDFQ